VRSFAFCGVPLCSSVRWLIKSYVSRLSGLNFNTNETDAANVTSPDLRANRWSHGRRVRNKCPHTNAGCTALVKDDLCWQAVSLGLHGLPGIKFICCHWGSST